MNVLKCPNRITLNGGACVLMTQPNSEHGHMRIKPKNDWKVNKALIWLKCSIKQASPLTSLTITWLLFTANPVSKRTENDDDDGKSW